MLCRGCSDGHINEESIHACVADGTVRIVPAKTGGGYELLVSQGHHIACVAPELAPAWCRRTGRGQQQQLCCPCDPHPDRRSGSEVKIEPKGPSTELLPHYFLREGVGPGSGAASRHGNLLVRLPWMTGYSLPTGAAMYLRRPPSADDELELELELATVHKQKLRRLARGPA